MVVFFHSFPFSWIARASGLKGISLAFPFQVSFFVGLVLDFTALSSPVHMAHTYLHRHNYFSLGRDGGGWMGGGGECRWTMIHGINLIFIYFYF